MIKIKLTGNTKDKYERLTWDDMQPCSTCKSLECETAKGIHEWAMSNHNTCIDLIEAKTREEILEIWATKCDWLYGFSKMSFYPAADEPLVILEILPKDEDDVLAMNQTFYDRLREIAYDEDDRLKVIDVSMKKWVKNLKENIIERLIKAPVSKREFLELELKSIWQKIDQQKDDYNISLRSKVKEELDRIKRGIKLFNRKKLIQDEYKESEKINFSFHFMKRIIASDLAHIILDLERMMKEPLDDDQGKKSIPKGEISFKWRSDLENELPVLYEKMKGKLIAPETTLEQFTAIFTGKPIETIQPLEWINQPILFTYFIDRIVEYNKIMPYNDHWMVGSKCFYHSRFELSREKSKSNAYRFKDHGLPKYHNIIDQLF